MTSSQRNLHPDLQTFHHAKHNKGSQLEPKDMPEANQNLIVINEPQPLEYLDTVSSNTNSFLVAQLYTYANTEDVCNDHDYLVIFPSDSWFDVTWLKYCRYGV